MVTWWLIRPKFWGFCDVSFLLTLFLRLSIQNLRFPESLSVRWLFFFSFVCWSACSASTSLETLSDLYGIWCFFSEPDFWLSPNVLGGGVWITQVFKCLDIQNATYLKIQAYINGICCSNTFSWKSSHLGFNSWIFLWSPGGQKVCILVFP